MNLRKAVFATALLLIAGCSNSEAGKPAGADASNSRKPEVSPPLIAIQPPPALFGTWRSVYDANSTLTIDEKGGWTDAYKGMPDVSQRMSWRMFSGAYPPPGARGTFTPSSQYFEVKDAEGVFYYFEIGAISAGELELFYVGRGNRHAYAKVR